MESKELREYIQSQINNKVAKEEIIKVLKEQGGWSDKDIADTFSVIERDVENQERQPEQPEIVEETRKNIIPTRLGSLIILLVTTIAGAGVWWYSFSYEQPQTINVEQIVRELQARRKILAERLSKFPLDYELKAKGVYYQGELIERADPKTFEYIAVCYAKDKNYVYCREKNIKGADVVTFGHLANGYAKDKNNTYYNGKTLEADTATFEAIGNNYAKDEKSVFFVGRIVEGADTKTFELIENSKRGVFCARDKNYIYIEEESFPFEYIGRCEEEWQALGEEQVKRLGISDGEKIKKLLQHGYEIREDDEIYYYDKQLIGADIPSLEYVAVHYAKDKKDVFFNGWSLESADVTTFKYIAGSYAKDKNRIYHGRDPVYGASLVTFVYIKSGYAKDKNYVYFFGKIVEGINPVNCTADNLDGCRGK